MHHLRIEASAKEHPVDTPFCLQQAHNDWKKEDNLDPMYNTEYTREHHLRDRHIVYTMQGNLDVSDNGSYMSPIFERKRMNTPENAMGISVHLDPDKVSLTQLV